MASKHNKKTATTAFSKSTFSETIFKIAHRFSLAQVFDDFLMMAIAACTINPETKLSYYEEEYLTTIAKYKDSDLRFEFPNAFAQFIQEMEERFHSDSGSNVLGEFFEQHISNGRNGQFFTPQHVCDFMASITHSAKENNIEDTRPLRILDPACGSGRMLIASHKIMGRGHEYYGIDIDRTCVKMCALNFFLNGIWRSEVMCANALMPNDFVIAYRISLLPLRIFKIEEKENSTLWHLYRNSFASSKKEHINPTIKFDSTPFIEIKRDDGMQLNLF